MEMSGGYKRTEAGMIPKDWEQTNIGNLATFSGGSQPPRSTFRFTPAEGYIRLVQIRDYKTDEYASFIPESMARKKCDAEDIMIGRYGPPIFQILSGISGAYNVALIKATPHEKIVRKFFFYVLSQERLFHLIDSLSRRSSGQTGVEMPALKDFGVALPPITEQRAIATALSDVDALLGGLDQLIVKKRGVKQAAMQQLLTGKARLSGFSGEWEIKRLDQLGMWRGGMTPSMQNPDYWLNGSIPWISSGDVKSVLLTETGFAITPVAVRQGKTTMLPAEAIVMVTRSGILRNYLPIAMNVVPMAINQDIKALVPAEGFSPCFLLHALIGNGDRILAGCLKSGTTVESVEFRWLKAFSIPVPPLPEQTAIAAILTDMDAELSALEARRDKTLALKQAMMQELLTGRTRLVTPKTPNA